MKPIYTFLIVIVLLPFTSSGQQLISLDPTKDPVARRSLDGSVNFIVPIQAMTVSMQEAMPFIAELQTNGIQKIGKSSYIVAHGKELNKPENNITVAILLIETEPGIFQVDDLVISCSSSGGCRECSLPPICQCNKGAGNCGKTTAFLIPLKKVTLTLVD